MRKTRSTPFKHEVKNHTRRTKKGKLITVSKYDRGTGIPKAHKTIRRNRSLIPKTSKKVSYTVVEALHRRRTPTARKIDESLRAPLTEDYHQWIHAPNEWDVTGVDSARGFTKVDEVDISKYQHAQISMNQIGQIYRVDVWDHDGKRIVEKFGFKKQKEAIDLVTKIREQKKGRSDEEIKLLKRGIDKNLITTTAIDGIIETIKKDKKLSDEQKKDLVKYAKEHRSEKEDPLVLIYEEKSFKPTLTNEQIMANLGVTSTKKPKGIDATYNLATGWMRIVFDEKPSRDTLDLLKGQGFRYRPSSKAWSAKYGYGREELLKELAGEVKEVNIPVDFEKKAEYYTERAVKTQDQADEKYDRAKKKMDFIPIGQPILVGHHSERKHRGDLMKIESGMRKSIELGDKAKKLQETADRYGAKAEGKENPRTIKNRIKGLEADIRRLKSYSVDETGEELKRSKKQIDRLDHLLNLQRERYTQTGGMLSDTVTFKPGMVVHTTNGKARIKKVSGKSVRVELITDARSLQGPPWNNLKMSKDKILKVYDE